MLSTVIIVELVAARGPFKLFQAVWLKSVLYSIWYVCPTVALQVKFTVAPVDSTLIKFGGGGVVMLSRNIEPYPFVPPCFVVP